MKIHHRMKEHIKNHLAKRHHHTMDNNLTADVNTAEETVSPPSPKPGFGKINLLYLLIFIIIAAAVGLGIYFYSIKKEVVQKQAASTPFEQKLQQIVSSKTQFQADERVAQIGDETIYGSDLNYVLFTFYNADFASPSASLQPLQDKLLAKAQEQSIILQEGKKAGFITLSSKTFNNPTKDLVARNNLISTAEAKLREKYISKISGESISIWFHNTSFPDPKMGVEAAKTVTRSKMESLYSDLKAGKITFLQAKAKIAADTSLAAIDPAYKSNAYYAFNDRDNTRPLFIDPEMNKAAWMLKEGEMSQILTANDFGKNGQPYEALFKIIKINKKSANAYGDFNDWLNAQRSKYAIKQF